MRKAINENPVVQAGLVGVLALAVGLMLLMRTGGSGEDTATTDAAATQAVAAGTPESDASASATATPATPAPTDPATGAAAPATPDAAAATGAPTDFKPGPGLPADLVNAYGDGKAVALMIFNDDGIDDRELKAIVGQARSHEGVAVFVTEVKDVADYSRITGGVDLDRTPALVVVRPKKLTDGPMPTAVVSYGFRGARSVEQALDDALYKGPTDLPYYPK